jgi:sugar phosphate isomerase/epimerase
VEAYPNQPIGGELEGRTHHSMPEATREGIREKLEQTGIRWVAYGVVRGKDAAEWRSIFEFAAAMGIETVTAEPDPAHLPLLNELADQHEINVAIHNHPKPSRYWDPAAVLEACREQGPRIGACPDTGHWVRSGLDPVESLALLEGRIISLHLKDVSAKERRAHDVPWGTGVSDAPGMLRELKRQGFRGIVSIEYEHNTPRLVDDVGQCVAFFYRTAAALLGTDNRLALRDRMVDDVTAVFLNAPSGAAGTWPGEIDRPGKEKAKPSDPDHGTPHTVKAGADTVYACGKGFPGEGPEKAFDGDPETKWCIARRTVWVELRYTGKQPPAVTSYRITSANDDAKRDPRDWTLSGSDDGKEWKVLDTRRDEDFPERFLTRVFDVAQPGAYRRYKLAVTRNNGDYRTQFAELTLETAP